MNTVVSKTLASTTIATLALLASLGSAAPGDVTRTEFQDYVGTGDAALAYWASSGNITDTCAQFGGDPFSNGIACLTPEAGETNVTLRALTIGPNGAEARYRPYIFDADGNAFVPPTLCGPSKFSLEGVSLIVVTIPAATGVPQSQGLSDCDDLRQSVKGLITAEFSE